MIQWNLTLTGNQIAILKNLAKREFGKEHDLAHVTQYIGGIGTLMREGLIVQIETKTPDGRYNDTLKTGQFITDRGRFILQMIEEDIAKFLDPKMVAKLRPATPTPKRRQKVS